MSVKYNPNMTYNMAVCTWWP